MAKGCKGGTCGVVEAPPPVVQSPEDVALSLKVGQSVLTKLGKPRDLHSVTATKLFEDRFRVNVRRVLDDSGLLPRVSITDSFYCRADTDGNVFTEIGRKY